MSRNLEKTTRPDKTTIARIVAILGLLLVGASSDFDSGAFNPEVTQNTIEQTICVPGYTKAVRPSTNITYFMKQKLLRRSGHDRGEAFDYKLDHVIPVALGGHPSKIENLELRRRGASRKHMRELEAKLHCLVCAGEVTLADAQQEFSNDWQAAYLRYAPVRCQRGRDPLHLEASHRLNGA